MVNNSDLYPLFFSITYVIFLKESILPDMFYPFHSFLVIILTAFFHVFSKVLLSCLLTFFFFYQVVMLGPLETYSIINVLLSK